INISHSSIEEVFPQHSTSSQANLSGPFANSSIFGLLNWMWTGSAMKSLGECIKLFSFLQSDAFRKEDIMGVDFVKETAKLDEYAGFQSSRSTKSPVTPPKDGWQESEVIIQVPDSKEHTNDDSIPTFAVPGLHHRSITAVIRSVFEDPIASRSFHYTPFKSFWKSSNTSLPAQRVYDEIYSSDAMIEAHLKLQQSPPEPGCQLERVVAPLMCWSDSTHLANFGTASLWPLYLFFGNQSKSLRGKPRTASCHHIAYIPKLPPDFHDFFSVLTGEAPTADILTHCRRELMHAVWAVLLDAEFMHAYEHGIVIECPDGKSRRFYPQIFTYSADYPEKVLLATIRNLGSFPCPRCLVPKEKIPEIGTKNDDRRRETNRRVANNSLFSKIRLARTWIYNQGLRVKAAAVERLLSPTSLVPTVNAFSILSKFGFDYHDMLVVDFMHEFELGVWKALFKHLLRILFVHGGLAISTLNERYRAVPTFGRSTIRRFTENASAMKKLAARNYEDLLQCAIPVFEGLIDEPHNSSILSLLFTFAEWHSLAKLRMHTDDTLGWLDQTTKELGTQIRKFARHTCSCFDTVELPAEEAARARRRARKSNNSANSTPASASKKKLPFNLIMYKLHALGDYVRMIRMFGTTDSYSTQSGELEHRRVKRFYARTNKNTAVHQMTRLERREYALRSSSKLRTNVSFEDSEALPYTPAEEHHHISKSRNFHMNIIAFLSSNQGDPAIINFRPKLEEHVLARLQHPGWSGNGTEFSETERRQVIFANERIYRHKIMRVNYTTYDVRRGQDSLSSRKRSDVMMLARETDNSESSAPSHPFEYARIIGIFHVDVVHQVPGENKPTTTSIETVWVRRFRIDITFSAGFKQKRLHRIEFLPSSDHDAFGFVHPDEIIRGAHLIPAFFHGGTDQFLSGVSLVRNEDEVDDYRYFYVNIFVDRDMYMRY
ncbi:hypothetical protein HYPSUDRAFT_101131, partial [Hypholoma sublateritium FD-334 SS-4]